MKQPIKYLLLVLPFLMVGVSGAAAGRDVWNRHSVANLNRKCIFFLTQYHKNLTDKEKENVAHCFSHSAVAIVQSPSELERMSKDAKFKLMDSLTRSCAKRILGITLQVPEMRPDVKPDKSNIVGHWYDGKTDFYLSPDGKVSVTFEPDRDPYHGTWILMENLLTLKTKRELQLDKITTYYIAEFQDSLFLYGHDKIGALRIVQKK